MQSNLRRAERAAHKQLRLHDFQVSLHDQEDVPNPQEDKREGQEEKQRLKQDELKLLWTWTGYAEQRVLGVSVRLDLGCLQTKE